MGGTSLLILVVCIFLLLKFLPSLMALDASRANRERAISNETLLLNSFKEADIEVVFHSMLGGGDAIIALCRFNQFTSTLALANTNGARIMLKPESIAGVETSSDVESTYQSKTRINSIGYGGIAVGGGSTTGRVNSQVLSSTLTIHVLDVADPRRTVIFSGYNCSAICDTWADRITAWVGGAPLPEGNKLQLGG